MQVPRARAAPLQLLTRELLEYYLEPDVGGAHQLMSRDAVSIFADVRREEPCEGTRGKNAARASPVDWDVRSRRVVVTIFADVWVANLTGLPLTLGQTRPGFSGVEGTAGSIVPCGHQFADLLECDECYENERFNVFFGPSASSLLPTDPHNFTSAADSRIPCRREDYEARLPAGWTWIGEWQVEPWDHEFDFRYFTNGRHDFNPDRRTHDHVRRRRHYRLRVLSRGGRDSVVRCDPGIVPSYVVQPPAKSSSIGEDGDSANPLLRTPKVVSGTEIDSDPEAAFALVSVAADAKDAKFFVRLLSGPWSEALVLNAASGQRFGVSGPPDRAPLGGVPGGEMFTPITRCHVVAHVTEAPLPFRGSRGVTRVLTLRAAVTLVNATGAPLYWRQADSGRSDTRNRSPLRTILSGSLPEHQLAPGAATPVWHDAEGNGRGLLLSPAAAQGGWSPPLDLHDRERRFAVLIPICKSDAGGGVATAYVASALGPSPVGALVLGVTVRPVPGAPGCFVAVAALHTLPGSILRPPVGVLSSAAAAAAVTGSRTPDPELSESAAVEQPPFLCVINYSRAHVGFQLTAPREVFSEHGQRIGAGEGGAVPVLGPQYAESVVWAPSCSAVPLGLASSADLGADLGAVVLRVLVVEERAGTLAAASPQVGDSPLAAGALPLHKVGRSLVLRAAGDTIVIVRILLRGPTRCIIVHDTGTLGPDLLQLLVAAAPRGGPGGAEAFELLQLAYPHGQPQPIGAALRATQRTLRHS